MRPSELKSGFRAEEILVMTPVPARSFAAFERVFGLEHQPVTEAIAEAQTRAPEFGGRIGVIGAIIAITEDRVTVGSQNFTEAHCGVKFAGQLLNPFDRVIKDIPAVVRRRVVVIV